MKEKDYAFILLWKTVADCDQSGCEDLALEFEESGKTVDTQLLAENIAEKSSLTPGDVQNVIRNLMSTMRMHLLNSRTVRLNGLGTFTMKARTRGKGVEKEEDVNPNQVTALRCQFTPEYTRPAAIGTTRALLQGVEFENIGGNRIGRFKG